MSTPIPAILLLGLLAVPGCAPAKAPKSAAADSTVLAERAAGFATALAADSGQQPDSKPLARWVLPHRLAEISGLALTADGRLLAHNDEIGRVFEIDYRRGVIVKQFWLGQQPVHADFEGIAVAGSSVYLLASNGTLYEFPEGADDAHVRYTVHDTRLGHECEFEGLEFEAASKSLLLLCKVVGTKRLRGSLVIYRWKREAGAGPRLSTLAVPLAQVIGTNRWTGLHPSDIAIDPVSGNYVIVSAQEEALVEITPAGEVVSARPLPEHHRHTEGIAITRDGVLIISDEAGREAASITLYRRR